MMKALKLSVLRKMKESIYCRGQSLIEVLASMSVILVVIVGIMIATVYATRNSLFSKNQALATKYAQEKMEEVRSERDQNADVFFAKTGSETETIGIFTRTVTYTQTEAGKKTEVNVIVSWSDQTGTHQANQTSLFTKW